MHRLLELNPSSVSIHLVLGYLFKETGDFNKALDSTLKYLQEDPENSERYSSTVIFIVENATSQKD